MSNSESQDAVEPGSAASARTSMNLTTISSSVSPSMNVSGNLASARSINRDTIVHSNLDQAPSASSTTKPAAAVPASPSVAVEPISAQASSAVPPVPSSSSSGSSPSAPPPGTPPQAARQPKPSPSLPRLCAASAVGRFRCTLARSKTDEPRIELVTALNTVFDKNSMEFLPAFWSEKRQFHFTRTDTDRSHLHGYCIYLRMRTEKGTLDDLACICILSKHQCQELFRELLSSLATALRQHCRGAEEEATLLSKFAADLVTTAFPQPGQYLSLSLRLEAHRNGRSIIPKIPHPLASMLADKQFGTVTHVKPLHGIPPEALVDVLQQIAYEGKVIVIAPLDMLSKIVHALLSLFGQFRWEGLLAPVLPHKLITKNLEIFGSPHYIFGVPNEFESVIDLKRLSYDVRVLKLSNVLRWSHGRGQKKEPGMSYPELPPLPRSLVKVLMSAALHTDADLMRLQDTMKRFWEDAVIRPYRAFTRVNEWDPKEFVAAQRDELREFLKHFVHISLFHAWRGEVTEAELNVAQQLAQLHADVSVVLAMFREDVERAQLTRFEADIPQNERIRPAVLCVKDLAEWAKTVVKQHVDDQRPVEEQQQTPWLAIELIKSADLLSKLHKKWTHTYAEAIESVCARVQPGQNENIRKLIDNVPDSLRRVLELLRTHCNTTVTYHSSFNTVRAAAHILERIVQKYYPSLLAPLLANVSFKSIELKNDQLGTLESWFHSNESLSSSAEHELRVSTDVRKATVGRSTNELQFDLVLERVCQTDGSRETKSISVHSDTILETKFEENHHTPNTVQSWQLSIRNPTSPSSVPNICILHGSGTELMLVLRNHIEDLIRRRSENRTSPPAYLTIWNSMSSSLVDQLQHLIDDPKKHCRLDRCATNDILLHYVVGEPNPYLSIETRLALASKLLQQHAAAQLLCANGRGKLPAHVVLRLAKVDLCDEPTQLRSIGDYLGMIQYLLSIDPALATEQITRPSSGSTGGTLIHYLIKDWPLKKCSPLLEFLQYLRGRYRAAVDAALAAIDVLGNTPLNLLVQNPYTDDPDIFDLAAYLLGIKPEMAQIPNRGGTLPLHMVAGNRNGRMLVHLCAFKNSEDIVSVQWDMLQSMTLRDEKGQTPYLLSSRVPQNRAAFDDWIDMQPPSYRQRLREVLARQESAAQAHAEATAAERARAHALKAAENAAASSSSSSSSSSSASSSSAASHSSSSSSSSVSSSTFSSSSSSSPSHSPQLPPHHAHALASSPLVSVPVFSSLLPPSSSSPSAPLSSHSSHSPHVATPSSPSAITSSFDPSSVPPFSLPSHSSQNATQSPARSGDN